MKILIVDDNEDSRMILRKALEHDGYRIEEAFNGAEALQVAKESPPDMIVSDILMPEMDGFKLCHEVKHNDLLRKTPFVFYTSTYIDQKNEKLAISLGASRFIVKPVDTSEFLDIIKEVFREYREMTLPVPERPFADEAELSRMYKDSIASKLDEKMYELRLFREIFINANDAIAIFDAAGLYIRQNSAHRALIGYSDEALLSKTPAIHLGEEVFLTIIKKLSRQGVYRGELTSYTKERQRLYIELSAFKIANEKGGVSCYVGIIRDITARMRSEKALRLSEEKFSKAFRSSPIYFTINTLHEGRYIDVNDAFLNAAGYTREEIIGRTESDIGMWGYPSDYHKMLRLLRDKKLINNFETEWRIKSGEMLTVLFSAELIEIDDGPCILAVVLDITERKKLENQLLHAQKMEAIGQLAGGIAHDFNNILSAIVNYAYILKMRMKAEDPSMDNIEQILSLSGKASEITQGLLTFGRKDFINPIPLNLNNAVMNMEKLLTKFIGEDIRLSIKLTDKEPVIMADSVQIEQVIINFATNARDAMPDGGSLTIETELVELDNSFVKVHGFGTSGTYAVLSVSDTGSGMDEETRQKIFEPFFTTKEIGKGTGLGLAIIYGIVKRHNGYITVYSEAGQGTCFKIYFQTVKFGVEKREESEPSVLRGNAEVILLAEDETAVRNALKSILQEHGYRVIEAVDGEDAVKKYTEHKDDIQLLILDVIMPGMNGKIAFDMIQRITPGIKAIFTSGYTAEIINKKGIIQEGLNYVAKPVLPNEFLRKIRETIDR